MTEISVNKHAELPRASQTKRCMIYLQKRAFKKIKLNLTLWAYYENYIFIIRKNRIRKPSTTYNKKIKNIQSTFENVIKTPNGLVSI